MRRKKKKIGCLLCTLLCTIGLVLCCGAAAVLFPGGWAHLSQAFGGVDRAAASKAGAEADQLPADSEIYSAHVLLMDLQSGRTIYSRSAHEKACPASLTKMLTVLCAIEACGDLDQRVTLTGEDFKDLKAEGASVAGFLKNESVTLRDLLYGAMLPSGADAAQALANHLFGSQKAMVEQMNQLAASIGMADSHFSNVTGLHDRKLYTTAADMCRFLRYALQNETFREIFTARRYTVPATNLHPEGFTVRSLLFDQLPDAAFPGGEILGGKTGFTDEAGLCLASLAEKDGREYILVTLGAPGDHNTEAYNIEDALTLYTACPA